MKTLEIERTFLAKFIPKGLKNGEEMLDIYLPKHCQLRIRKKGNNFEITKKMLAKEGDASELEEHTIKLTKEEFNELSKLEGGRIGKTRYKFFYSGATCEVDIFKGPLKGLVLIDFEFSSRKQKNKFKVPDFCLPTDVTQEKFIAGGVLCGKSYEGIKKRLERFGYKKL